MAHGDLIQLRKTQGEPAFQPCLVLDHLVVFAPGITGRLAHVIQALLQFVVHAFLHTPRPALFLWGGMKSAQRLFQQSIQSNKP